MRRFGSLRRRGFWSEERHHIADAALAQRIGIADIVKRLGIKKIA